MGLCKIILGDSFLLNGSSALIENLLQIVHSMAENTGGISRINNHFKSDRDGVDNLQNKPNEEDCFNKVFLQFNVHKRII